MSLTKVSYSMITGAPVTPQDFGAAGNGSTNDTEAINAMFATGKPWYIPYTPGGYLVNAPVEPKASGVCDGFLLADTNYAGLVVKIQDLGYQPNVKITGLDVRSKTTRVANSIGIRVNSPSIVLDRCKATGFDYGIQVCSYSVALMNCNANLCNTNLSAYAPSSTSEINDLKIIGGNYDSAIQYSCRIGDPRFSTTVPPNELMGTTCTIIGAAFDGAVSTFDRIYGLTVLGCYWENSTQESAIVLGGSGNGWMRVVKIEGCYFSGSLSYSIYAASAIRGLKIGPNYYGGNQKAFLYLTDSNLYGFEYHEGVATNPPKAAQVHTGFGSVGVSGLTFSNMTNTSDFLVDGVQLAKTTSDTNSWYPNGKTMAGDTHITSATGRFKTNYVSSKPGVFNGTTFTFDVLTDSYYFNGGDRISTSTGDFSYVRSVDYVAGTMLLDGGTPTSGGGSVSQSAIAFNKVSVYGSSAPSTGTYLAGDKVYNSAPTAGGVIGWVCVSSGSPGTWKSFGAISA